MLRANVDHRPPSPIQAAVHTTTTILVRRHDEIVSCAPPVEYLHDAPLHADGDRFGITILAPLSPTLSSSSASSSFAASDSSPSTPRPPPASVFHLPATLRTQILATMMVIVVEAVAATFPLPLVGLFVAYMGKMEVDDAGYISGYLVAAYFLGQVISGPICGRLSDIIGRRAVLLAGLLISAQLSLVFGFSTTPQHHVHHRRPCFTSRQPYELKS
ncbi:transmembrane protein, putative [Bodo saltans]|uniref:Transmembrane protein, putative n=1 Tax=Bodo saltans TaxID=75058 RepID=A0A0S4JHM9_BODSA|nr:transmembrane protein, putative [Bodo saltans]|eukprot:CUG88971.1 transmembrane protein, putative [Bodo saltans]